MKILLIRHGITAGNLEKRYVGRTDEPLCQQGIEQLRLQYHSCLQELLLHMNPQKQEEGQMNTGMFLYFIISPMRRCRQTAELLAEWMGITMPQIIEDIGLREMDFGDFEYKNYEELYKNPYYQQYIDTNGVSGFPGAESIEAFKERCIQAFAAQLQWLEDKQAENVVFVVHGGTIMSVMERFAYPRQDYFCWQVENGGGYLIDMEFNKKE